jgi:hypothetical protein
MRRGVETIDFILALIIAVFLVAGLLSQRFLDLPYQYISVLILVFVAVKLFEITRSGGTIFEDYVAIVIIIIFGIVHFALKGEINAVLITAMVFILIYSVGLMPWIDTLFKSRKSTSFVFSYGFFVMMTIFLFAGAYFANPTDFAGAGFSEYMSFEDALYFSTMTFTTVGYGDISPLGINKLISSFEAISGIIFNIAFIGYIFASKRFKHN